jgi:hypothetical protein
MPSRTGKSKLTPARARQAARAAKEQSRRSRLTPLMDAYARETARAAFVVAFEAYIMNPRKYTIGKLELLAKQGGLLSQDSSNGRAGV